MKIEKIDFKKKQAELIIDGKTLIVELALIFKYNIHVGRELSLSEYRNLCNENDETYYYRLGIEILKKSLTVTEFRNYLLARGAKEYLVSKIISTFIAKNYLNDLDYARNFLELKGSNKSFLEIENELIKKGISSRIIVLLKNDYPERQVLSGLMDHYLHKNHRAPKQKVLQSMKRYFFQRGFDESLIEELVGWKAGTLIIDEKRLIDSDYQRLLNKYNKQLSGIILIHKLKEKLILKGYKISDIEEVINEKMALQ